MSFADPPLRSRRIALIGFAETTWPPEQVWADDSIEKWTLNHGHRIDPRWDRLFELHSREVIEAEGRLHIRDTDQWAVLQAETRRPIYMKAVDPDVPCSVAFPIKNFCATFAVGCDKLRRHPYAEMAAAYMLGYAVMELNRTRGASLWKDRDEIHVYGFELFDGEEYAHQRACFEFYAGYALGSGIRMQVPETSAIFSNRGLYEYDNGEASALLNQADVFLKQRFDEVKRKFGEAAARNTDAVSEMQTLSGIMQEVEQERKAIQYLLKGGRY